MYQFPSMPLLSPPNVALVADWTSPDEDAMLDAWLASLEADEFDSVLRHLMDHPGHALTVLDSTA